MRVEVRNGNLERAMKVLKRKLVEDGMFRELQARQAYEKPSDKRKREHNNAVSRQRKADKERMEPVIVLQGF
jgi:small subunit ribosomal protein S21